jgi:predicted patatin/cPLA2 family phospholipase
VVTNSLTTANTAQANAKTIVNGNDSLPSKLISINQSKQANRLILLEKQKLNGLKSDNPADNTIINNFYQQYQTLNTATNALMTNYTEQKRIADLEEAAWQNQLTVVTSSVTAANTAQGCCICLCGICCCYGVCYHG